MHAQGWAAVDRDGTILIKTVSPTEEAAMVNWIVVGAGQMVTADWSVGRIREAFSTHATRVGVTCRPIVVNLLS